MSPWFLGAALFCYAFKKVFELDDARDWCGGASLERGMV